MWKTKKFKGLVLPETRPLAILLIGNIFITVNNQALGSQLHLIQSYSHALCVIHIGVQCFIMD